MLVGDNSDNVHSVPLVQNAYDLEKVYEATNGQFLDSTAYSFVSPDSQHQERFPFPNAADLHPRMAEAAQNKNVKPFKRFPIDLYEQVQGKNLFDSEVDKLLSTKATGKHQSLHLFQLLADIASAPAWCLLLKILRHVMSL